MNREACCLQLGQLTGANWNHPLASGFTRERRLLHPATALRHSTNELLTELKLNLDLEKKKKGIGNPMYFNRRVFLHTYNCLRWMDIKTFFFERYLPLESCLSGQLLLESCLSISVSVFCCCFSFSFSVYFSLTPSSFFFLFIIILLSLCFSLLFFLLLMGVLSSQMTRHEIKWEIS